MSRFFCQKGKQRHIYIYLCLWIVCVNINTSYLSGFSFLWVHLSNESSLYNTFPLLFILFFVTFQIKNGFFLKLFFFKQYQKKSMPLLPSLLMAYKTFLKQCFLFAENFGHPFRLPVLGVSFWSRALQFVLAHPVTPHLPPPLLCLDTDPCVWTPALFIF